MSSSAHREAASRLAEIDALQDEVLRQLAELEQRIAAVLAEYAPSNPPALLAPPQPVAPQPATPQPAVQPDRVAA